MSGGYYGIYTDNTLIIEKGRQKTMKKGLKLSVVAAAAAAAGAVVFWKKKNCNKCIDSEEDELMDATGDDAFSEVAEVAEDIKEAAKEEAAKVEAKAEEVKEEAKAEEKEEKK